MTNLGKWAAIILLCVANCGCGPSKGGNGPEVPQITLDLKEVGELIRACRKTPAKAADLQPGRNAFPRGMELVGSGAVVVIWGAKMAPEGDVEAGTAAKGLIAHEKKAPTEGGYALLQDGSVQMMTPEQFKSAPLAK